MNLFSFVSIVENTKEEKFVIDYENDYKDDDQAARKVGTEKGL